MRYQNVRLPAIGYTLPEEVVTTAELEDRLEPLYSRLRLPAGRLELMTGIRERRFWPAGTLPSENSIVSGRRALEAAGVPPSQVGALIHASVCRDHLEPATASRVHHALDLPPECLVYDVSNACLGVLNGILQVADLIELGRIRAGLIVGSEGSRELVEHTVGRLRHEDHWTRRNIKPALASLTIGSASCAVVLVHRELAEEASELRAAAWRAETRFHDLCRSGSDEAVAYGMQPWMETDAERLMVEGVRTGAATFDRLMEVTGWQRGDWHRTIGHQVGHTHRRELLSALGLEESRDFTTYEWLGNTGSAALPVTTAIAAEEGHLQPGHQVGLLGIGSGINCVMLGVTWTATAVRGGGSEEGAG